MVAAQERHSSSLSLFFHPYMQGFSYQEQETAALDKRLSADSSTALSEDDNHLRRTLRRQQSLLLSAIVRNCPADVDVLAKDERFHPNFVIAIGFVKLSAAAAQSVTVDQMFQMKKILGESPTVLHIAILNVYHRCTEGKLLTLVPGHRRTEIEKAKRIVQILVESCRCKQDGNTRQPMMPLPSSMLMFPWKDDRPGGDAVYSSPQNFTERIRKLTASLRWKIIDETFVAIMDTLEYADSSSIPEPRDHDDEVKSEDTTVNNEAMCDISRETLDDICNVIFGYIKADDRKRVDPESSVVASTSNGLLFMCHDTESPIEMTNATLLIDSTVEKREP